MTDRSTIAPMPPDPGLPGARGLLSSEGTRALGTFLADRRWSVEEARPVQVLYRPERSCVVRYRVRARTPAGAERALTMAAEVRGRPVEPTAPPASFEERHGLPEPVGRVGPFLVWTFPYDPALPSLPEAAWGPSVRASLRRHGGPLGVGVQTVAYRPRRRAVLRYRLLSRSNARTVFGKVVRGSRADRWRVLTEAGRRSKGPVRLSLPFAGLDERTMLLEPLPGRSLRDLLLRGESLPTPERIASLVRLPERLPVAPGSERPGPLTVAESTARLLGRLVPSSEPQVRTVVEAVAREAAEDRPILRPVHGDLYEAQVYVAEDFSLGLIDLDEVGPGDPAMDAANFCAHLLVLALAVPRAADRLLAYRLLVREAFANELRLPPGALAWREALAMLLLATGPFRVVDPNWPRRVGDRIDLAVRLLERAERNR